MTLSRSASTYTGAGWRHATKLPQLADSSGKLYPADRTKGWLVPCDKIHVVVNLALVAAVIRPSHLSLLHSSHHSSPPHGPHHSLHHRPTPIEHLEPPHTITMGKKRVLISYGVDVDAVSGWLGSYGGEDSPNDISRGESCV